MNKDEFIRLYYDVKTKNKIPYEIKKSNLDRYCKLIESWEDSINVDAKEKKTIEICELYSFFWGVLSESFYNINTNGKFNETRLCIQSFSFNIANNVLAMIKLSCNGLDYQVGILYRNTLELCFSLSAIIIDKNKLEAYFSSTKLNNEKKTWEKYFRFSELNKTIENFENSLEEYEENKELSAWRKDRYSYYSGYVHNNFSTSIVYSFAKNENIENDMRIFNIWGTNKTRIEDMLGELIGLMMWATKTLFTIILKSSKEEQLIITDHDALNEIIIIYLMVSDLESEKVHQELSKI